MKDFVKIISLLSFVLLIFIKVSGFHVYTHFSEDSHTAIENCTSCELAIEQQQDDDFITSAPVNCKKPCVVFKTRTIASNFQSFTIEAIPSDFFSRPPPTTI